MSRMIRLTPLGEISVSPLWNRTSLTGSMALVVLVTLLATWVPVALAQDGATLTPNAPGSQVDCGEALDLTWTYAPESALTPALRGYSVRIQAPLGLTFDAADITVLSPLGGVNDTHFILENGPGDVTIDFAFLDLGEGLTATAPLFTIAMTGNLTLTTDVGTSEATMRDLANQPITTDISGSFAVDVDCTGSDIPSVDPEPAFTAGTVNTVSWSDESATGAVTYNVQAASDGAFLTIVDESGWIGGLNHQFTGLAEGTTYYYRVAARNFIDLSLGYSDFEASTQDDTPPVSSAGPLDPSMMTLTFEVPVQFTDALSGPGTVELFYNFGGGAWTSYGSFPADAPVAFTSTDGDGLYGFYTQGTDAAGNTETAVPAVQASTTLNTTGPYGTFTINNGTGATNNVNVTLQIDPHRVNEMRFSNDGSNYPEGWVAVTPTHPWAIDAVAGTRTVWGQFREGAGLGRWTSTTVIDYDTTPTAAVTAPAAAPGHEMVTVTWTNPVDADFDKVEIWRGLMHDGSGASDYPDYSGSTIPTPPANRAAALTNPDWVLAGTSDPGATEFIDAVIPRGVNYYAVFPLDTAGNDGPPAATTPRSTNYILGDIGLPNDGLVGVFDQSVLGATYGRFVIEPEFNIEADIGPTDDDSGTGIPEPDGIIDFEDVQIASQNFEAGNKGAITSGLDSGLAQLTWRETAPGSWTLELKAPCAALKGLRVTANLPAGVTATVEPGDVLHSQAGPVFLQNIPARGLDTGMSVMGRGVGLAGKGTLLTVVFEGIDDSFAPGFGNITLDLRDITNQELAFEIDGTKAGAVPLAFALAEAYPNPFNPQTTIKFSLPAASNVRLEIYGLDGRRVATLVNGELGPGAHEAIWRGRDDSGRAAASGVYFTKLTAGSLSQVHKMTLMK